MKIAIFYHVWFSDFEHGMSIVQEQLCDLHQSGLLGNASEFHIGATGAVTACAVSMLAPEQAQIFINGTETCGELPTLCKLQAWLPEHKDWLVAYAHCKGAQYPKSLAWAAWRRCMMKSVVWGWEKCVRDLRQGFDVVGCHWISPQKYGVATVGKYGYFGGNIWFASARHLLELPPLSPNGPSRYDAEIWVGKLDRKIRYRDYGDHWPGPNCMRQR